ncbi:MAG: hypothetical protein ACFFAU_00865 [Candidatus Hodarchaeota archaeon]
MTKLSFHRIKTKYNGLFTKKRQAVSPVLATVIIFGLIITGVMLTFIQVVPYIEKAQSEETISSVQNSFLDLDWTIRSLMSESGGLGAFRTVLITAPAGRITFKEEYHHISLKMVDQEENELYSIMESQGIGVLDWIYNSPQSILPRGTTMYLTGADPYKVRDPVFITGPFAKSGVNTELTNLTLSHQRSDRRHHITLNYRISVYITISTNPEPEIRFQIFFIHLSSDFNSIVRSYEQIKIHSLQNVSIPRTIAINSDVSTLDLVWSSGDTQNSLWSTRTIQGLSQVNFFNVIVQTSIFEIGLSIS